MYINDYTLYIYISINRIMHLYCEWLAFTSSYVFSYLHVLHDSSELSPEKLDLGAIISPKKKKTKKIQSYQYSCICKLQSST